MSFLPQPARPDKPAIISTQKLSNPELQISTLFSDILYMELFLASNNRHKKEELEKILDNCNLLLPSDKDIDFDCDEDGTSYFENAIKKARTLYQITGKPILADDSGLSVSAMDGAPGLYSARFGNSLNGKISQEEKNLRIIEKIKDSKDRSAFFVCNLVLFINEYKFYSIQETVSGAITIEPEGEGGFGYDPIFFLPEQNKTMASLSETEKNRISHRGKAAAMMKLLIQSLKGE